MRPIHIILFMLACMAALALVCVIMPEESQWAGNMIRTPQLSEVLELELDSMEIFITDSTTHQLTDSPTPQLTDSPIHQFPDSTTPQLTDSPIHQFTDSPTSQAVIPEEFDTTDTRIYLTQFYAALRHTQTQAVRVVHYGDSQIEEDRLSIQVRRALQKQYGGGGVGLIPLHQTIPTRTIRQSIQINGQNQAINQGPKRYLVYGPKSMRRNNSLYGPMGQIAIMDNALVAGSEDIIMQVSGVGKRKYSESYFNRIRVVQSGNIAVTIEQAIDHEGNLFILPDSTTSATIHLQGNGEVYGISLEKDHGVMVDNIPMRGSSGAVFTSVAPNEMQDYYERTNTRLIIMQFGGNIMPFTTTPKQVAQYINQMQTQIQYLKYLAPESSIVFVGPSDMSERRDGELQTYRMIPVMDRALQRMAIEEEIAYFSLYQHMGGKGSMIEWKNKGWAGGDYVHFTPKGADQAGEMLAEWLMKQ